MVCYGYDIRSSVLRKRSLIEKHCFSYIKMQCGFIYSQVESQITVALCEKYRYLLQTKFKNINGYRKEATSRM